MKFSPYSFTTFLWLGAVPILYNSHVVTACLDSCEDTATGETVSSGCSTIDTACNRRVGICLKNNNVNCKGGGFVCWCDDLTDDTDKPYDPKGEGDPHFWTWQGNFYSYQGVCDLVAIHNENFDNGQGLDLHLRTESMLEGQYSFISDIALKLGNDVLEVRKDRSIYVNGKQINRETDFPLTLGNGAYPVSHEEGDWEFYVGKIYRKFNAMKLEILLDANVEEGITAKPSLIRIRVAKEMANIEFEGSTKKIANGSVGMMGTYPFHIKGTHGRVARDGLTLVEDPNDMADEWQVGRDENDPILFLETRYPQYPQKCTRPTIVEEESRQRRLRQNSDILFDMAKDACAYLAKKPTYENCIFDVMATGDADTAIMYGSW